MIFLLLIWSLFLDFSPTSFLTPPPPPAPPPHSAVAAWALVCGALLGVPLVLSTVSVAFAYQPFGVAGNPARALMLNVVPVVWACALGLLVVFTWRRRTGIHDYFPGWLSWALLGGMVALSLLLFVVVGVAKRAAGFSTSGRYCLDVPRACPRSGNQTRNYAPQYVSRREAEDLVGERHDWVINLHAGGWCCAAQPAVHETAGVARTAFFTLVASCAVLFCTGLVVAGGLVWLLTSHAAQHRASAASAEAAAAQGQGLDAEAGKGETRRMATPAVDDDSDDDDDDAEF